MSMPLRFRMIREHLGLSTRIMADQLGISKSLWAHYESGLREPSVSMLKKLGEQGISLDWLVLGSGTMIRSGQNFDATSLKNPGRPAIPRLLADLSDILNSHRSNRLMLWAEIVDRLEQKFAGLTFEELKRGLNHTHNESEIRVALQELIAEGIVGCGRDTFNLIRAHLRHDSRDAEMRTLVAMKVLLEQHLSTLKSSPKRARLATARVYVTRGQGAEIARHLWQMIQSWKTQHPSLEVGEDQDCIHLVLASSISGGLENDQNEPILVGSR